ncbi:LPS translocon maturation chaperone LptM [Sulfurisoma sediminicola]|nr:lipoprotein [Sulfurisoma sediminicola]
MFLLGSAMLLAACGSKGPLYLPPPPAQQAPAADNSTAPGAAR